MARGKRFPIIDLDGPGTVELTLEQRYAALMNIFKHQYFAVYRNLGNRFGIEVANEIAAEVAEEALPFLAEAYRKKFALPGSGAALLSQILQAEFQAEGSDVAVIEESADSATVDVLCMFGDALQSGRFDEARIEDGLCNQGCMQWLDRLGKTIDESLETTRETWMGDGAERCRFSCRKARN